MTNNTQNVYTSLEGLLNCELGILTTDVYITFILHTLVKIISKFDREN
jgi:hypothetical protein